MPGGRRVPAGQRGRLNDVVTQQVLHIRSPLQGGAGQSGSEDKNNEHDTRGDVSRNPVADPVQATSCDTLRTPGEGIRIEELTELSHHSLIQYRLPASRELIPLLQIAPSKTDEERLLVVSPELADVLSAIMCRIRGTAAAVPLVVSYDKNERAYNPPIPLLFQWRCRLENRPVGETSLRSYLDHALAAIGVKDGSGRPLRYTFHDFRRLFITDAILHGMPPHIAQLVAGHRDISTTMGYKATPRK
jgi:hypothetical protein